MSCPASLVHLPETVYQILIGPYVPVAIGILALVFYWVLRQIPSDSSFYILPRWFAVAPTPRQLGDFREAIWLRYTAAVSSYQQQGLPKLAASFFLRAIKDVREKHTRNGQHPSAELQSALQGFEDAAKTSCETYLADAPFVTAIKTATNAIISAVRTEESKYSDDAAFAALVTDVSDPAQRARIKAAVRSAVATIIEAAEKVEKQIHINVAVLDEPAREAEQIREAVRQVLDAMNRAVQDRQDSSVDKQVQKAITEVKTAAEIAAARFNDVKVLPLVDRQAAERAQTYLERVVDRQINKVRGILTFDSILIVAIRTLGTDSGEKCFLASRNIAVGCLWVAIFICLIMFVVHWGDVEHYRDAKTEFDLTTVLIRRRSTMVLMAVVLSGLAVAFGVSWPHIAPLL